jgi:hypothetical protein
MMMSPLAHAQNTSENFKCVAMGKPGAKIKSNGAVIDLPAVLDQCDGAVALSDETNICYRDNKKQRKCAQFKKNQTVTLVGLAASTGESISSAVLTMARGDVQTLAGQTRSMNSPSLGMPYGPVIAENQVLQFDLSLDPKLAKAMALEIVKDGSHEVLINQPITSKTPQVSVKNLTQDVWYRWVADVDGKKISGKFLYVGPVMNAVRDELKSIDADSDIDPMSKAYLRAEIFNDNGLVYERLLAVNEFKKLSK